MLSSYTRYFVTFLFIIFLTGCEEQDKEVGPYSMLNKGTPEYSAVQFIRSIYEDDDLDVAISLSSDRLGRILKKYHTNRNVQRHLFNLKYDTVVITPQSSNRVGRSEFAEKATITVFLSGMYDGDKIEDMRSLDLINEDGEWKVSRIHPDHFM